MLAPRFRGNRALSQRAKSSQHIQEVGDTTLSLCSCPAVYDRSPGLSPPCREGDTIRYKSQPWEFLGHFTILSTQNLHSLCRESFHTLLLDEWMLFHRHVGGRDTGCKCGTTWTFQIGRLKHCIQQTQEIIACSHPTCLFRNGSCQSARVT
jgi:hypothetical protein